MSAPEIITFPVAPLDCNCSIIRCPETNETIIVDPGGEAPEIIQILEEKGCRVKWIIHTHAHFDHCLGTHEVASSCRNKGEELIVALHPGDNFLYENLPEQCRWFGFPPEKAETLIDRELEDDLEISFGSFKMNVLHTPGHTPGSCCFNLENTGVVFSGDTLFAQGVGRTDLPGGDESLLRKSIRNRLLTLDDGTHVIPGHGPFTRIYEEKRLNPFL